MYRIDISIRSVLVYYADVTDRAAELELAILGLLKQQELHGYELKKRLVEVLGVTSAVSFGSLYPALARFEAAGLVKTVAPAARPPIPHTGSLGGELAAFRARVVANRPSRGKKVYGLTDLGEARFAELLADPRGESDDRAFTLRFAFARYLTGELRLRLLERRRVQLLERQAALASRLRAADRLDRYRRSLMERDQEQTDHDLSWLDRLIAAERAEPPFSPSAPSPAPTLPSPDTLEDQHP